MTEPKKRNRFLTVVIVVLMLAGCCVLSAIAAVIALPRILIAPKGNGNETAAIGALKTIGTQEALYREADKEYATLALLEKKGLIDSVLGSGTKQGYLFQGEPSTSTPEFLYWAVGRPVVPGSTGTRVFFTNDAGVIYYLPASDPNAAAVPDPKTCEPPKGAIPIEERR